MCSKYTFRIEHRLWESRTKKYGRGEALREAFFCSQCGSGLLARVTPPSLCGCKKFFVLLYNFRCDIIAQRNGYSYAVRGENHPKNVASVRYTPVTRASGSDPAEREGV